MPFDKSLQKMQCSQINFVLNYNCVDLVRQDTQVVLNLSLLATLNLKKKQQLFTT